MTGPPGSRARGRMVREDLFEDLAHLERVAVALVVVDVAAGERRLIEVPGQDLLVERQRRRTRPRSTGRPPRRRLVREGTGGPSEVDCLLMRRRLDGPAELAFDARLERVHGPGSPWTRHVSAGGRLNPRSQRRISFASACADMESTISMSAATGTSWPWMRVVLRAVVQRRPRVPAA